MVCHMLLKFHDHWFTVVALEDVLNIFVLDFAKHRALHLGNCDQDLNNKSDQHS